MSDLTPDPAFLVNTITSTDQDESAVASLTNGDFVITWIDIGGTAADPSYAVKAQIFDPYGTPIGGEFLVNTTTGATQAVPVVAGLPDGGFVITWTSFDTTLDGSGASIEAQVFDASGTKVGGQLLVNTDSAGDQYISTIAALSGGGFVISWYDSNNTFGNGDVKAQVFDAAGAKVGTEFLVNTTTYGDQRNEAIAPLDNGGFVIAWNDSSTRSVKAQIFDASGNKVGAEFLVNTTTPLAQLNPQIATLSNGDFVVVWCDASAGDVNHVLDGQIFDATGAKVGGEFLVAPLDPIPGNTGPHSVSALPDGGFVVTWDDGEVSNIFAQRFDSTGAPVGDQWTVNDAPNGYQMGPNVASLVDGGFVITWWGQESALGDASGMGIAARIYEPEAPPPPPIVGTAGPDKLIGTDQSDTILGLAGNDRLL